MMQTLMDDAWKLLFPTPDKSFNLAVLFFLQLTVILAACRVMGVLARYLGQPQVVAEMIAGVMLGPSLFGRYLPQIHGALFPAESLKIIYSVSQVGLVLYMFLVGVEFDVALIRRRKRVAMAVSVAGMIVPFLLGGLIAWQFKDSASMFAPQLQTWEAMLYMGAAMCITAFPMLARIIYERGLSGTSMGTLALAAGSSDDAAAWCLLAIVLASFGGGVSVAIFAVGGGVLYALFCIFVLRRLLRPLGDAAERRGEVSPAMFSFIIMLVMLGAWFTDAIGIYAVFGAFLVGIAIPRGVIAKHLHKTVQPLTTTLLLPLFFTYSGLNTRLDAAASWDALGLTALVLLAACVGKGVACAAAARVCGEPWRESMAIGALMNSRGLMELIIINIGLQRGVITPMLFSMMVVMAVVTTFMATPLFELVYGRAWRAAGAAKGTAAEIAG